jgi:signal transduction histidine kinase
VALSFAASAAAIVAASAVALGHQWRTGRGRLLDHLETMATVVGANCTAALAFGDTAAAREALASAAAVPGVKEAVAYLPDGRVFASAAAAGASPAVDLSPSPGPGRSLDRKSAEVIVPVRLDGRTLGLVRLAASTAEVDRETAIAAAVAVAALLLSLLATWFLLARLIGRVIRPIRDLSALTEQVAAGREYGLRAAVAGDDELATLATGFNQMLTTIQQRDAELEAHRSSLASEVEARTADLAATNARLHAELEVRHRVEGALTQAARRWYATFDAIREGVCVLDAGQRVAQVNQTMRELLGSAEVIEGQPVAEMLAPLLLGVDIAGPRALEERLLCQAGERWFELRRDRIGEPSAADGWVLLVADVTGQQNLQEQLTQAQKMEAVGQLAGGVAHDFNNLLTVILTYAGSLRRDLPQGDLRSCAEEILGAGQRATALTRQLLAFSRKQVLRPEALEVREVAGRLTKMIGRLIGEHIELAVHLAGSSGYAYMDPSQLEQILVNLAVNARDAMPEGGRLTIETRDVEVTAEDRLGRGRLAPGPYVRLRVSDTGVGMDSATQSRIFEPFFTTKAKGKGTGLGLAMVYGAVQQSGGAIDVASAPGAGTVFTIHLPRVLAPDVPLGEDAPAPAPGTARGNEESILVVEDDPQVRSTLRHLLSAEGYRVVEASNGSEALAAFDAQREAIDLVLTDLVMPGVGGVALGRSIAEASRVPILYMSGYSEEIASGRERIPAEVFVQKPFDPPGLLQQVRAAIDGGAEKRR